MVKVKELYKKIQSAKEAYNTAINETEKNEAKAFFRNLEEEELDNLDRVESELWRYYEGSKLRGNKYLDIDNTTDPKDAIRLIELMKEQDITSFTFSSTWSGSIEIAWVFQAHGCKLKGLVEINSGLKAYERNEYEKVPAYLFKIHS